MTGKTALITGVTGQDGAFQSAPGSMTYAAVSGTTQALVSSAARLALQGGRLNWEVVAADAIYGMQSGLMARAGSAQTASGDSTSSNGGNSADLGSGVIDRFVWCAQNQQRCRRDCR